MLAVCAYVDVFLVGVSHPAGCWMGAANCDGTQATRISQDTKLMRGGGSSVVIVCGHVSEQSKVDGECQGVGIIADSVLRAKKPLCTSISGLNSTLPPLMKMKFYDPSSSLTAGLLMSFQQGGGWVDVGLDGGYCTRCTHTHSYQLPLCYRE